MQSLKPLLIKISRFMVLAIVAVGTFSMALAYTTWTGPTASPPGNNVSVPINISSTAQTKAASITVSSGSITAPAYNQGTLPLWAYGGMYNGTVGYPNPYTGSQSCSAGYVAHIIFNAYTGCCSPYTQNALYECTSQ